MNKVNYISFAFKDPQLDEDPSNEKGFYISFDDQPKRPKPPLRTKRSPKKDKGIDSVDKNEKISQMEFDINIKQGKLFTPHGVLSFKLVFNKH